MIIQSLLDTDLYKFTMMQVVLHHFPGAMVAYGFKCRTPGVDLKPYAAAIREQIAHLCALRFSTEELNYLKTLPYIKSDFIEFLRIFQLNPDFITISTDPVFDVSIKGPWLHTILFEVPILAIISEVYFQHQSVSPAFDMGRQRLAEKIALVKSKEIPGHFQFSEFGTRRRYSREWHEQVIQILKAELRDYLVGSSNVLFAKNFHLEPVGTMAHEYIQACQALGPRLLYSQRFAFEVWAQEYRGDLGIALSDTYSIDAFLNDFDLYFCKLFDGARQDSGDPFYWAERMIAHYQRMNIDPLTKTLVFSDALDFQTALNIFERFSHQTKPMFGIGTNLTNDLGHKPLEIVIKMISCNGQPVAKISDSPEKIMCRDPSYLAYLKQVFHIKD